MKTTSVALKLNQTPNTLTPYVNQFQNVMVEYHRKEKLWLTMLIICSSCSTALAYKDILHFLTQQNLQHSSMKLA